jgi:hypothetical protein
MRGQMAARTKKKAVEDTSPPPEKLVASPELKPAGLGASLTPQITLTATLDDINGAAAGTVANPAKLRIALCGFGLVIPQIQGTATLAKIGPTDYLSTGGLLTVLLWGNDVITPLGTYYTVTILDGEDNIVQSGMYQFTGTLTIDLSNAPQIVPTNSIAYLPCTGAVPGTTYRAAGVVVAALYNGVFQRPGIDYTLSAGGKQINLTFETEEGDTVTALCTVVIASSLAPGASMLVYTPCAGAIPGTVYTATGQIVAVAYDGVFQRLGIDYTTVGEVITLNFSTNEGDTVYALCF